MAKRNSDGSLCERIIAKSTSGGAYTSDYSVEWKIKNFRMLMSSEYLTDDHKHDFEVVESHGYPTNWTCGIFRFPDGILVYLDLKKAPSNFWAIVNYSFERIKPNGIIYDFMEEKGREFVAGALGYGFKLFEEFEKELEETLWEDGSIVIKLTLKLFLFKRAVQPKTLDVEEEINRLEKREIQNLTDFTTRMIELDRKPDLGKIIKVVSKDRIEFYANTVTLSARSQVFEKMFRDGNWKKGQGSTRGKVSSLVLEDLSGKTVKVLLHFLLGGVLLKGTWEAEDVILELTNAAHEYQLHSLTEFLDKVLPEITFRVEFLAKLALLTKRLGMRNAEKGLFLKVKETATDIEQLIFDKEDNFFRKK